MIKLDGFDTRSQLIIQKQDPARKDKEYYKANIFAMYGQWLGQASTIGYNGVFRIDLLRAFADGRQPDDPIRKEAKEPVAILDANGNPTQHEPDEPMSTFNVHHEAWQIFSPANKIVEAIDGKLTPLDYEVQCDPMDYDTRQVIENAKLFAWQFAQNQRK